MEREITLARDLAARSTAVGRATVFSDSLRVRRVTLGGLLAVGVLLALINLRWPVARNALDYMKAALEIIARHFNLSAVAHDQVWTGGKPLLFSFSATPLVWLFGGNAGIVLASMVGTGFFLVTVAFALPRLNQGGRELNSALIPLELIVTALNPLVLYQFWSGYPDSLFAGLVILAFILSDIVATDTTRDTRWHIVWLGLTICAAIHTKLYGAVLGLTCPVYVLVRSKQKLLRSAFLKEKLAIFCATWLALLAVLVAAKLGLDPLLDLGTTAGFGDYIAGFQGADAQFFVSSLRMLAFSLLLVFQVALLFLFNRRAWLNWGTAPMVFIGIYLVGLLPSSGTSINMRYFLPAFPFLTPLLALGARSVSPRLRRLILSCYGVIAIALALNFNVAKVEEYTHPFLMLAYARYPQLVDLLDNLRLPVQIALRKQIDTINKEVPAGSTLYWSSDYYKTATHGLAYHLGVKRDIAVRYVLEPSDPEPSRHPVFLTQFTGDEPPSTLWRPPSWSTPIAYGNGLFRLDPVAIELVSLSGDYVNVGDPVHLRAESNAGDGFTVQSVEFLEGGRTLGVYREAPFEMVWQQPGPGRHEIVARVHYAERPALISRPVTIYVGSPTLVRVARETEDLVAEYRDGLELATQGVLVLDPNFRLVGVHFRKIDVRRGARISAARLRIAGVGAESKPTVLEIRAELSPSAAGLALVDGDLSHRPVTVAHVTWELAPWIDGQSVISPSLAPILEEVLSQSTWQSGNSLMLLIRASGQSRFAQAADRNGQGAPALEIELRDR